MLLIVLAIGWPFPLVLNISKEINAFDNLYEIDF